MRPCWSMNYWVTTRVVQMCLTLKFPSHRENFFVAPIAYKGLKAVVPVTWEQM